MSKKNLLVISDFIEGKPVIASVRYEELMAKLQIEFNLIAVNNYNYGEIKSKFCEKNFKYTTLETSFASTIDNNKNEKKLDSYLRNKFILQFWRSIKLNKTLFLKKNHSFLKQLQTEISTLGIDCIFVTVPDIYGLYIVEKIKQKNPSIPVVIEIRDIINHSIGIGNPKYIYSKAEKILIKNADEIIGLSEGIKKYYESFKKMKSNGIKVIKNGYDHDKFLESRLNTDFTNKNRLVFSHIGSIYKGRNIGDLIKALELFADLNDKEIIFNIVGVLDKEALEDIKLSNIKKVNVNVLGTKSHNEAIEILNQSDIAVILTHKTGSEYAIPGKTFEYIGACKPILAVSEDIELINFINPKYGVAAKHNVDSILHSIVAMMNKKYNFSDRKIFSREHQASEISKVIYEAMNEKMNVVEI